MPKARRVVAAAAAVLIVSGHANAAPRTADVQIDVSWDMVMDCSRPLALRDVSIHGTGTNVMSTDATIVANWQTPVATINFSGKLGGGARPAPGGSVAFKVLGANGLQMTWNLPQNAVIARVSTNGKSCNLSVASVLKPGFREHTFVTSVGFSYCERVRVTRTQCSIH